MMIKVYVLKSLQSGILYVGITDNIERRLKEHNTGKSKFTKGHLPWEIIYTEDQICYAAARAKEKYFKTAAGKKALQKSLEAKAGSLPD
jgi:predicted GIY-YIG superfamily endonuclease